MGTYIVNVTEDGDAFLVSGAERPPFDLAGAVACGAQIAETHVVGKSLVIILWNKHPAELTGGDMDLKSFVRETIVQICQGVTDATAVLAECGAIVNPPNVHPAEKLQHVYGHIQVGKTLNRPVHLVEFDVAVHASEGTETKGGVGITVASLLSLGSHGKSEHAASSVSRVQFAVPVALPQTGQ